jgi:hypothetical protein
MLARRDQAGLEPHQETVNEATPMRQIFLLTILCLAGCSALPSLSEQGLVDQAGWRHQQAILDANAIVDGMDQARARSQREVQQAR